MRGRLLFGCVVLTSSVLLIQPSLAVADGSDWPSGTNGAPGSDPVSTPEQAAALERDPLNLKKDELVALRVAALEGEKGAMDAYEVAFEAAIKEGLILPFAPTPAERFGTGQSPAAAAYDSNLWNTAIASPQLQSNWCGPATAYTALVHYNRPYSQWDGQSLSQLALAGSAYTGAGASGGTDWVDGDMERALNRWGGFSFSRKSPGSALVLKNDITSAIDWGIVPPQSVIEPQWGNHYNNHPANQEVRHWIGVRGYTNWGGSLYMWDPAGYSTAVGWPGVMPYFSMTPSSLYWYERQNGIDNSRGYVW